MAHLNHYSLLFANIVPKPSYISHVTGYDALFTWSRNAQYEIYWKSVHFDEPKFHEFGVLLIPLDL